MAALSSLFKHLVRHGAANRNPVVDVQRPAINRDEGSTAAFSKAQARKILDAPPADTIAGLRNAAACSPLACKSDSAGQRSPLSKSATFTKTGASTRCASPARVAGAMRSRSIRKPRNVSAPIDLAGHGDQLEAPLFRPLRGNAGTDFSDVAGTERIGPVTPGDALREEFMVPLGPSARALARELGVPSNRITAIPAGDRGITAVLGRRFGTTAEFWLNLQMMHELEEARQHMRGAA